MPGRRRATYSPAGRRGSPGTLLTLAAVMLAAAAACGGDGPTGPSVATVQITSPIGGVMAVGRSVALTAAALDGSGSTVPGQSFSWRSANTAVATVSPSGVVQAVAAGSTTIYATTGGVEGRVTMRAVDADLETLATILDDAYTTRLRSFLTTGAGNAVGAALDDCDTALSAGDVLGLQGCLEAVQATSSSGPTDRALLAVLGVITEQGLLLLNL